MECNKWHYHGLDGSYKERKTGMAEDMNKLIQAGDPLHLLVYSMFLIGYKARDPLWISAMEETVKGCREDVENYPESEDARICLDIIELLIDEPALLTKLKSPEEEISIIRSLLVEFSEAQTRLHPKNGKPGIVYFADDDPTTTTAEDMPPALRSLKYPIKTSQEYIAIMSAIADGKSGTNWENDDQTNERRHKRVGAPHSVSLSLPDRLACEGLSVDILEQLTADQDADACFALMYVSNLLLPTAPLSENAYSGGWIDLDDVASKIWPAPRSTKARLENRRKIYKYLIFGECATIEGERSIPYYDKTANKTIQTQINGPIWRFMGKQEEQQPTLALYPMSDNPPLRVELIASRDWTRITTDPNLQQYLPCGEILGAIPGNKAAGAWARVIGLALMTHWRKGSSAALNGDQKPRRKELLTLCPPKLSPPLVILGGNTPGRAVEYWHDALQILVDNGLLNNSGEAKRSLSDMKSTLPRQDWQEGWLNEQVDLRPGTELQPTMIALSEKTYKSLPRNLAKSRRGRFRTK